MTGRAEPSILHVDLDAFFASVEQRDKPSLRGKPVIVGGLGPRGVVATASYEARVFGVRSAMSTAEARARCPNAAFLSPRFAAYQAASATVMGLLAELSPLVEPLSLDEAYVDLAAGPHPCHDAAAVREIGAELRAAVLAAGGLVLSVGAGTSKLVAKIASDLDKPDGLRVVPPGEELALLHPLPVARLPGVGPATAERLRRLGVATVAQLAAVERDELVALLGPAHGGGLWHLARAEDDRRVQPERESKSVSAEETFDRDIVDQGRLAVELELLVGKVAARLRREGASGRTITVKVRQHDFTTLSRSQTLPGPTDDLRTINRVAGRLLGDVDTTGGVRLLGAGVSGLTDWTQEDLFDGPEEGSGAPEGTAEGTAAARVAGTGEAAVGPPAARRFTPGQDVLHASYGRGWVQGSGVGRVTVRFESRDTPPGVIRTFRTDDPDLAPDQAPAG